MTAYLDRIDIRPAEDRGLKVTVEIRDTRRPFFRLVDSVLVGRPMSDAAEIGVQHGQALAAAFSRGDAEAGPPHRYSDLGDRAQGGADG